MVVTGDRRQETGDKRQETGDKRQETGDRRQTQETRDRRQETGIKMILLYYGNIKILCDCNVIASAPANPRKQSKKNPRKPTRARLRARQVP